jgi:hypothetical protein
VLLLGTPFAAPARGQTASPSASVSPNPAADPGGLSPAAIVIGLALVGGLYLARRRMDRGAGGR